MAERSATALRLIAAAAALSAPAARAQDHSMHGMDMPMPAPAPAPAPAEPQDHAMHGMAMPGDAPAAPMPANAFRPGNCYNGPMGDMAFVDANGEEFEALGSHVYCPSSPGSGTSRLPAADGGMHGLHIMSGGWMLMAHGAVAAVYAKQGGPRGDDQAFVSSMAMLSGERDLGEWGHLQLRTMVSLEPLMGQRGYPNLFATGETAHGTPLVDRQHPHDLFMELTGRVDVSLGGGIGGARALYLYGGPVGEPALGPSAFMHRRSARYLPLSPITHHWFDSTHISYGVVTAGFADGALHIEASAFRGREPDERRWDIETPALDSWSGRVTWTPNEHIAAQVSHGFLKAPEPQHPGESERRTTATIHYARDGFSAMAGFAAKNRVPGPTLTAWIGEANWDLSAHHSLFGRVENVANDELFPDPASPLHDRSFRVTRAEAGYAWRAPLTSNANLALGGTVMAYAKPAALDPWYGKAPLGFTAFAKVSLGD